MLIIVPKPVLISVNAKGENMKLMIPILFISSILFAGDNTTRVKVSGMMCSYSCVSKVNTVVKNIDGVYVVTNNKFYGHFEKWKENYGGNIKIINDMTNNNEDRLGAVGDIGFVVKKEKIKANIIAIAL